MRRLAMLLVCLAAGCGDDGGSRPLTGGDGKASADLIAIVDSLLLYLPDQTGGNFHEAIVRVKNTSDRVALDVGGQLSVKDDAGQLVKSVKSVNPTTINLLPGQEGLLSDEALDLPAPIKSGKLDVKLSVGEFRDGPSKSPVFISKTSYAKDEFGGCKITGTASNTFSQQKENLQLRAAGFSGGQLVTGGFTYVDEVFSGQDATFEIDISGAAACPPALERVAVYPNLGEDKIFDR